MVVLSKKVFEKIAYRNGDPMSCADLHIWEKSCWKASTSPLFLMNIGKGTAAFFLPIYVVSCINSNKTSVIYRSVHTFSFLI